MREWSTVILKRDKCVITTNQQQTNQHAHQNNNMAIKQQEAKQQTSSALSSSSHFNMYLGARSQFVKWFLSEMIGKIITIVIKSTTIYMFVLSSQLK